MSTSLPVRLFALTVIAAVAGCSSPPIVTVKTLADPAYSFAPVSGTSVHAQVWRAGTGPALGTVVAHDALTLEERNFLSSVESALRRSGFTPTSENAALTILAEIETESGMYDSYRRVPVMESSSGHYYGRDGYRPYHTTTTTDVIVPERRPFVHRIVTLTAIPAPLDSDTISPSSPAVVWRATVASDASVMDADLAHHLSVALNDWGQSVSRKVKHKPADR